MQAQQRVGLISGVLMVGMEYQQTSGSDLILSRFAISFQAVAACQSDVLAKLFWVQRDLNAQLNATPPRLQLLHNAAFEYAALLQVAGACQFAHQQHTKEQSREARLATGSRDRGSSRGSSGTTRSSSSSSSKPGTVLTSSFAQLVVPPDHELVASALGKEAVAAHARATEHKAEIGGSPARGIHTYLDIGARGWEGIWKVVRGSLMQSDRNVPAGQAAAAAHGVGAATLHVAFCAGPVAAPTVGSSFSAAAAAMAGAPAASSARVGLTIPAAAEAQAAAGARTGARAGPLPDALSLQLLLEAVALEGGLGEKLGSGSRRDADAVLECVELPLKLMVMAAASSSFEERKGFMAARGGFLLEVFGLLLREQEQQREVAVGEGL